MHSADNCPLRIILAFPVAAFQGEKRMILSTVTYMGGKNSMLAPLFMFVGTICILLTFFFICIHIKFYLWYASISLFINHKMKLTYCEMIRKPDEWANKNSLG